MLACCLAQVSWCPCTASPHHSRHGPRCKLQALPPISAPSWSYEGTKAINHSNASVNTHVWHYHVEHDEGYGNIKIDWRLYTDAKTNKVPLRFDMWGINWFTGGHWDHYIAEFYDFEADPDFGNEFWKVPQVCDGAPYACAPSFPGLHMAALFHFAGAAQAHSM